MSWAAAVGALNAACLGSFGQSVTYEPAVGAPFAVTGILETGVRPEDAAPGVHAVLFVQLADFAQPPQRGDAVTIGATTYKVFEIEADGQGGATLGLHQQ